MSHKLYGVHVIHPVDCMTPTCEKTLPHHTNEPIMFFANKATAMHYVSLQGKDFVATPTTVKFGQKLDQSVNLYGVGIIYRVDCPDNIMSQMKSGATFQRSLEEMHVEAIEVYMQNDPLHNSCLYSLYEMGSEMTTRWNDYRAMDASLRQSTPEMLRDVDLNNLNARDSLRLMFGETGRINENFFTSFIPGEQMCIIEQVMHRGRVGIGYYMHLKEVEAHYNKTLIDCGNNGDSLTKSVAHAAHEASVMLHNIAKHYNDEAQIEATFKPLIDAYAENINNLETALPELQEIEEELEFLE